MNYNANPAMKHVAGTLSASAAAALTDTAAFATTNKYAASSLFRYKAIWFNVAGTLDVVDSAGTKVKVIGGAGSVYPLQNCGAVTGGNTTLANGEFNLLYD